MAVYNEIQIGRLNRFLQKYLGIKGGPPAPQLQADIGATINLFNGVENRYLEGWDRYGNNWFQTAVGAQSGAARLRNPTGSNVIAVVEQVVVENVLAEEFLARLIAIATDLATVNAAGVQLDGRTRPNASMISSQTTLVAVPTTFIIRRGAHAANTEVQLIVDEFQQVTILPGFALEIDTSTVNQAFAVSMIWRERFLEDGERT